MEIKKDEIKNIIINSIIDVFQSSSNPIEDPSIISGSTKPFKDLGLDSLSSVYCLTIIDNKIDKKFSMTLNDTTNPFWNENESRETTIQEMVEIIIKNLTEKEKDNV